MIFEIQPSSGASANRGRNFDDYALGDGKHREVPPRQIDGTFRPAFVAMVRDFARVSRNPMTSFNYGFQEALPDEDAMKIMQASRAFVTYGLHATDVVWVGALHSKGAGERRSTDMHSAVVNFLLGLEVRWNPYFEGKDRAAFVAFTELINYAFDLASAKDPKRRRLAVSPPNPRDPEWLANWKEHLTQDANREFEERPFVDRHEFVRFVRTLEDVCRVKIDGNVVRAVVRDTEVVIKGALAAEWFYADSDRYQRKPKDAYRADFERGLKSRLECHQRLSASRAREPSLAWMQLVQVDAPIPSRTGQKQIELENQHSLLKDVLELTERKPKPKPLALEQMLRATIALLFSPDRERPDELKAKARKKGFLLDDILIFRDSMLELNPRLLESVKTPDERESLDELQSVIKASNALENERENERIKADRSAEMK